MLVAGAKRGPTHIPTQKTNKKKKTKNPKTPSKTIIEFARAHLISPSSWQM